jgi:hypothetical protein
MHKGTEHRRVLEWDSNHSGKGSSWYGLLEEDGAVKSESALPS